MPARKSCALLPFALAALLITSINPAQAGSPEAVGWQLQQSSKVHGQDLTVLITDRGVKWSNPQTGVTIFCQPPLWNVVAYGERTRRYFETPLASFHGHAQSAIRAWAGYAFDELHLLKIGAKKSGDFMVDEYGLSARATPPTPDEQRHFYQKLGISLAQLKLCRGLTNEKQSGFLLARLYSLPELPGVPIHFQFKRKPHQEIFADLSTQSIKKIRKPYTEFSQPRGFRRAGTFGELMNDASAANGVEGLMDSLGKPLYK